MAAAYRIVVAERKDILVVTVVCEECEAEVSVNAETAGVLDACPSCNKPYAENIKTALAGLNRFHRLASIEEASSQKSIFRFHIKQTD